jgi:hypothetical protein
VVLDVSDPARPREHARLTFDAPVNPHWLAADASGRYLAMNSGSANDPWIHIVRFDERSGALARDRAVDLGHINVPGLGSVRIAPHGTIFQ